MMRAGQSGGSYSEQTVAFRQLRQTSKITKHTQRDTKEEVLPLGMTGSFVSGAFLTETISTLQKGTVGLFVRSLKSSFNE